MRIANKPYLLQRRSNKDPGGRGNPSLASHRDAEVKFSWSLTLSLLMSILSSWSRVACKDLIRVEQCVFLLDPKPRTMFFGSLHHQVAGFPLAKSPKNRSKKSMLQNVFEEIVFTCGLCELVSCCTCKSHTTQSCCFLVWDQIMHFFCKKKTIFQDRWGSLKRATNFQGYRDQGRELFQGRLWPEWVPIKGYRMEVDIGIAALRQVAAAPIKVPDRKLCKSYLRKGLEVAAEEWGIWKKGKSLLHVSNITGKKH